MKMETDELYGNWESEDDGTGHHAIWGWGIEFKKDGAGRGYGWGSDEDSNYEYKFSWERINGDTIKIKSEHDDYWETISYSITDFTGGYNSQYFKLVDRNYKLDSNSKEMFWGSPEPLYKIKPYFASKPASFLKKILSRIGFN